MGLTKMDIVLEKLDHFKAELQKLLNKYDKNLSAYRGKDLKHISSEVTNLVCIQIKDFIEKEPTLNKNYTRRARYYYNLVDNSDYQKVVNNLIELIIKSYNQLNIDTALLLENNFRKNSGDQHVNSQFKSSIKYIFGEKFSNYSEKPTIKEFIQLIQNKENYLRLNPDTENIKEVINGFKPEIIFSKLDAFRSRSIPENFSEEYRKDCEPYRNMILDNAVLDSLLEAYGSEYDKLVEIIERKAVIENIEPFSILDKHCYLHNKGFKGEKWFDFDSLLDDKGVYYEGELPQLGIAPYALEVLKYLEWDYKEAEAKYQKLLTMAEKNLNKMQKVQNATPKTIEDQLNDFINKWLGLEADKQIIESEFKRITDYLYTTEPLKTIIFPTYKHIYDDLRQLRYYNQNAHSDRTEIVIKVKNILIEIRKLFLESLQTPINIDNLQLEQNYGISPETPEQQTGQKPIEKPAQQETKEIRNSSDENIKKLANYQFAKITNGKLKGKIQVTHEGGRMGELPSLIRKKVFEYLIVKGNKPVEKKEVIKHAKISSLHPNDTLNDYLEDINTCLREIFNLEKADRRITWDDNYIFPDIP